MNIFLAVIIQLDIFRHRVEIMEARQHETDSPVEKTAAQKIHAETCPNRVQNHIQNIRGLALFVRFFRRKRRVKVQLVEIMIPIAIRVVNEIRAFGKIFFGARVMNLRVHEAGNVTARRREKPRDVK